MAYMYIYIYIYMGTCLPMILNTLSNSFILSVPLLFYFSKWCYWEEIGRFKNWGAILEDVFPETLLSIDPTTDFLGMLVLRCETNKFGGHFANLWNLSKNTIPSRMLQNTQKGTNNIKTNTSPGGLADRHSRQPRLLDIYFFCIFGTCLCFLHH